MGWTDPVDLYCERLGPGFWAEPVNALSNLAFLLAAAVGLALARRHRADGVVVVLAVWVAAIGVGSFLFHTLANRWSGLADVLPIWSFVLAYVIFALRRFLHLGWIGVGGGLALCAAIVAALSWLIPAGAGPATNGSVQYLPAVVAFAAFGAVLVRARHPAAPAVGWAGAVFFVSLVFRSLDQAVCPILPVGTHALWHGLNGVMLAVLLAAAARHGGRPAVNPPAAGR